MADLIHATAADLWSRSLRDADRILVIGATGWFGRTAQALLDGLPHPRMFVASEERSFSFGTIRSHVEKWDFTAVETFAPTVILDLAFLTRDLVGTMSLHDYIARNTALTQNVLAACGLDSVERVITVSSGAAVYPDDALGHPIEDNPYGHLKREAEIAIANLAAENGISAVIARAWSVSGAFVTKPRSYALADMILQALAGHIQITASTQVFRRYTSVEDLLAVSLASALMQGASTLDSGGQLVEMQQLAEAVVAVVDPSATITRVPMVPGPANEYFSSGSSWDAATAALHFTAADLSEQIATTLAGLVQSTGNASD